MAALVGTLWSPPFRATERSARRRTPQVKLQAMVAYLEELVPPRLAVGLVREAPVADPGTGKVIKPVLEGPGGVSSRADCLAWQNEYGCYPTDADHAWCRKQGKVCATGCYWSWNATTSRCEQKFQCGDSDQCGRTSDVGVPVRVDRMG